MYRILFQIGPFTVYSYGLAVALAFLISTVLILRDAKKSGIPVESVFDCLMAVLFGGMLGGRILFVLLNWEMYIKDPLRIFNLQEGGMAIQGAILLALVAGIITAKIKKLPFWKTSDLLAPYIALGQSIGRIGCLLNGCCFGKIINGGIGMVFPGETVMRIPTQLFSSLSLLFIFIVLTILKKKNYFDGYLFSLYIILYGLFRFIMDFFRGDELFLVMGVKLSQSISAVFFLSGIILFIVLKRRGRKING